MSHTPHNDSHYQAYAPPTGPPPQQQRQEESAAFHHGESQPQSGPGVNAPLLDFNAGSGRYEAPAASGGGWGGEHEGGYQVPTTMGAGVGQQRHGEFGGGHVGAAPRTEFGDEHGGSGGFGSSHVGGAGSGFAGAAGHGGVGGGFGADHQGGGFAGEHQEGGFASEHGAGAGGFGNEHGAAGRGSEVPPGLPPRRTATAAALPQGQDRSHQVEVMQSYEMSRAQTEDEQNQAILQREFPKMDSSLIAAIYGDSGSLSATREMLQELDTGAQ